MDFLRKGSMSRGRVGNAYTITQRYDYQEETTPLDYPSAPYHQCCSLLPYKWVIALLVVIIKVTVVTSA